MNDSTTPRFVVMRNGSEERFLFPSRSDEVPPMDIPEATEADSRGKFFDRPVPQRPPAVEPPPSMWDVEKTTPYFIPLCVLVVLLGAFLPVIFNWLGA